MHATRPASLGAALLALTLATACASRGPAVPQPFPSPDGSARVTPPASDITDPSDARPADEASPAAPIIATGTARAIIDTALQFLGTPYRNGGADPSGFDCSGFVHFVFSQAGLAVPRTVEAQSHAGAEVGDLSPGDLVFFRTTGRGPTHVGIALGPDRFIHAPSSRGEVRIEPLARRYWAERYLEGRRLFQEDGAIRDGRTQEERSQERPR